MLRRIVVPSKVSSQLLCLRLSSRSFSTTVDTTRISSTGKADAPDDRFPPLKKIPSLPLFGSMIQAYSGIPPMDLDDLNGYFRKLYKEYGPFFSMGIPGFGSGIRGEVHVIRDPNEMLKVIKQEGAYPSGVVEREWPAIDWMKRKNYSAVALLGRGEEWKRIRGFMQKDLLAPASARDYLPGILKGAEKASLKAPEFADAGRLDRYFNDCAMDMFTEVLFGNEGMSPEDYRVFCDSAVEGLSGLFEIMRDPLQHIYHSVGYRSAKVKRFYELFDRMDEIARRHLNRFIEKAKEDKLTDTERSSYFSKLLQRQPESDVTSEELIQIAVMMYIAAVDTTASKTSWNLVQLALHPKFQDKLYEQLDRAVQKEGSLTANVFDRSEVPLLQACVRETHRCTPALFGDISKTVDSPTTVYGVTLPAGSTIMFDSLTNMWDPSLVEDPMTFQPERWLKDAVDARKGMPSALIDHPFYSGPFSQGARRCPGSRVAYLEVQAMIAQLLLHWKIEGPTNMHWKDYPCTMQTLCVPVFSNDIHFAPRNCEV